MLGGGTELQTARAIGKVGCDLGAQVDGFLVGAGFNKIGGGSCRRLHRPPLLGRSSTRRPDGKNHACNRPTETIHDVYIARFVHHTKAGRVNHSGSAGLGILPAPRYDSKPLKTIVYFV